MKHTKAVEHEDKCLKGSGRILFTGSDSLESTPILARKEVRSH
jgi:hypothetical protein